MAGRILCLIAILFGAVPALAQKDGARKDVVVVTSFPNSLSETFARVFEEETPGYRLRILNRKTTAALALLAEGRAEADVFWASAPDAFAILKAAGLLLPIQARAAPAGAEIDGYPLDDPDGLFRGFSISGYGIIWNRRRLADAGIEPPVSIRELGQPKFRGLIAMSAPSRSGTTHLMVESILQRYGWHEGWRLWLAIAGNLANVAARSFSVASGVAQGRYAIGLSIDFLGRGEGSAAEVGVRYPAESMILPASIALLRTGANPEGGERFARFVLGAKGQRLLASPHIRRDPVMPEIAASLPPPAWREHARDTAGRPFDATLSGQRYELVNLLFDELITDNLARIQQFRAQHDRLMAQAGARGDIQAELARAADLAATPPEVVDRLQSPGAFPTLRRIPRGIPPPPKQARFIETIRTAVDERLRAAEAQLQQVSRRLDALRAAETGAGR
ncbi:MAG: extracellular solute-binding protein [Proteobacteria bacterium]|nr:extracellular solute-binding protein [Pseudomonadota bacterium]